MSRSGVAGERITRDVLALHTPSTISSLPRNWSWRRLDLVCDGIFDCPHSTPVLTEVGPFIARSQDVRSGVFRLDGAARVSETTHRERIARAEPRHGDLLFSREGTYFGIAAEIPPDIRVCLGQRMVLLRPNPAIVHPRFLRYWLNSPPMVLHVHGHKDGTVAERLNMPTIRALPVAVPPLSEQISISSVLGSLDDKIELNRCMNETLETMVRTLFKSWFVDFDPVRAKNQGRDPGLPKAIADLFPDSFVDSELGEIPKGWEIASIGAVADVIDCLHSKKPERLKAGMPLLQLANIRDDGLIDMEDTYFIDEADYRKWVLRMEASPGDCVITNVGRVGAAAQMPIGQKAALGRNMTGVRCKPMFPFPTVLIECLLSQAMKAEIVLKMDTGTILDALNVRNIPKLRFTRSTRGILEHFEEKLRSLRAQMEKYSAESHALATLRDTLLPKLISGELRARDSAQLANGV